MKIETRDNNLIVFLNKKISSKIDIKNKINLEKHFQNLFQKLNDLYEMKLYGSYEIILYDNPYGIILEITKQDIDYFEYSDIIDMKINISKYNEVIYKIKDNIEQIKNISEIYKYKDNIYCIPKTESFEKAGIILENSDIIYGKKCKEIKQNLKKLEETM